jgi:hypothetical protein
MHFIFFFRMLDMLLTALWNVFTQLRVGFVAPWPQDVHCGWSSVRNLRPLVRWAARQFWERHLHRVFQYFGGVPLEEELISAGERHQTLHSDPPLRSTNTKYTSLNSMIFLSILFSILGEICLSSLPFLILILKCYNNVF